jgi:hypothetical protein
VSLELPGLQLIGLFPYFPGFRSYRADSIVRLFEDGRSNYGLFASKRSIAVDDDPKIISGGKGAKGAKHQFLKCAK